MQVLSVSFGFDKGAARLTHFFAIDHQETMSKNARWCTELTTRKHGWPK